ncbi:MAG: hypothetical protein GF364_11090 [Candidatus Lokiarchaeota archaeon]|nr:hypothetical protein [Candidatus Lokiarchaeota archaeon]
MVKHPKYQAMDQARELEIPRAIEEILEDFKDYELYKVEPVRDKKILGPIPRPKFYIRRKDDEEIIAEFHPNGYSECKNDEFKTEFDKINKRVEKVAQQALEDFLSHEKR